jgi:hypothetical protein
LPSRHIIMSGTVLALCGECHEPLGIGQPIRRVEDLYAGLRRSSLDQMLGAYGKLLRRARAGDSDNPITVFQKATQQPGS